MTSFYRRSRRRGVAAVLSGILLIVMIVVLVVGFFAYTIENNSVLNQAAQSKQGSQLTQAGEHLSLTVSCVSHTNPCLRSSSPEFVIQLSNHGTVTSTVTAVYVTNPSGQALSSGPSGSEYLVGPSALNVTLPITISSGASTENMTACGSNCNIGIYNSAILPVYTGGDVEVSVLTQDGSIFTGQWPSPIPVTTTTSVGSTSTMTLPDGSETTTTTITSTTLLSTSLSTTTVQGQSTPALVVSLTAECDTLCSSQSVLNGGEIILTGTVTNLASSQAKGVSLTISPTDGFPTGTATVSPTGACSPSSTTIGAGAYATFTCDFTASSGSSGGTITFDGYAIGTISGGTETSADATSNTLQIGYSAALAPVALNPLSFFYSAQSAGSGVGVTSAVSAAHVSDAATYVALSVNVTNVYGQPLTLMDLTDISTQSPYVGPDPAFYMVGGVTYPASGTPTITPYDCYPGSSTSGCTTIPVGGTVTLIFAACNPYTNAGSGNAYGDGSTTWIWTTNGKLAEADSGANCGGGDGLGWAPPVGSSVTFVLFYTLGASTSGTMYSALLPFSSMFETLPTTATVTCNTVGVGEGAAPCTGEVTCTDPYGQTSGSPTDGCTDSTYPTGDLSFTVTPTTGITPTSTQCVLAQVSNTESECSVNFTPSAVGSYTVSASYGGDSEHGPSSGSGTLTANPSLAAGAITPSAPTIDSGQSVTLSASWTGGTPTYKVVWYSGGSSTCSADTTVVATHSSDSASPDTESVSPTSNTYYCAVITDSSSVSVTDTAIKVTVDPALTVPTPTVTHNPADVGESVTFTASPSGGSGTYSTYTWTGLPTGCTASNSATITCSPSTTTGSPFSVKVAVTDSNANTVTSGTLTFTVDPALTAAPSATHNPVDVNQATTISAAASGGSGTYTYVWSGLPAGCSSTAASFSCTPTSNSGSPYTVQVVVTDTNGYSVTKTFSLTVDPALSAGTLSATHNPVDVGQATTLSTSGASGGTGSGTYTYSWSGLPAGCSSSNSASISCTPTSNSGSPYTVTLTVTDGNGQTATATLSLSVDSGVNAGTLSATHNPVDVSQATTISTSGASGGSGSYTYAWTNLPPGCSSSNAASISCTPTSTTGSPFTVTLTVTDSLGGTGTATLSLTVDPALTVPTPTVTHNPADVGESVTFTASPSGGSGTYSTYTWTGLPTGCTASNSATITCSPSTTTGSPFSVKVAVTDSNANTVTSGTLSFTVDSKPSAGTLSATHNPVVIAEATTISTSGASGGSGSYTYAWTNLPPGCSTSNAASISCTPTSATGSPFTVTLTVTDSNGGTATATLSLSVTQPTGPTASYSASTHEVTFSGGSGFVASTVYDYCLSSSSTSTSGCVASTESTFTSTSTGTVPSTSFTVPSADRGGTWYVLTYESSTVVTSTSVTT